jgi:hypothetical protein
MAGDLNDKYVEWNSRLIRKRVKHLRDNAGKNSCLIHGPYSPTTVPYNPSANPDVLEIVITRDLVSRLHLTTCSKPTSDHLPILMDTQRRSSFLNPPDHSDLRKNDGLKFQAYLKVRLPPNSDLPNEGAIDACGKELTSAMSNVQADSTPKCRQRAYLRPPLPAHIQDEIRLKNRLRRQW